MINNTESKKLYKVQSGVTEYPIGFPFQFNSDGVPQLAVTIGTTYLQLNYNCKLSEDNGTLILIPTEEEAETLTGPEDYSWMDKWVGAPLVITRDIPFVQESDYQLGRISSEQIEKDFDASVMRDQMLQSQIYDNDTDISTLYKTADEHDKRITTAQESADAAMQHSVDLENRISVNEENIAQNTSDIETICGQLTVQDTRLTELEDGKVDKDQGKINVGKVLTVGGDGMVVPKVSQGGSGMGAVAHDETLVGAGTDEYPLGVKDKVTITIRDWE